MPFVFGFHVLIVVMCRCRIAESCIVGRTARLECRRLKLIWFLSMSDVLLTLGRICGAKVDAWTKVGSVSLLIIAPSPIVPYRFIVVDDDMCCIF
jgi:hypothetical protein